MTEETIIEKNTEEITNKIPEFKTFKEIIQDNNFVDFVDKNISELRKNRILRPQPGPGYHYKRDWYDRMDNENNFNTNYFLKNIESIWTKKSSLPADIRKIIEAVCDKSFVDSIEFYKNK